MNRAWSWLKQQWDWRGLSFEEKKHRFQWQWPVFVTPIILLCLLLESITIVLAQTILALFGYWFIPWLAERELRKQGRL